MGSKGFVVHIACWDYSTYLEPTSKYTFGVQVYHVGVIVPTGSA